MKRCGHDRVTLNCECSDQKEIYFGKIEPQFVYLVEFYYYYTFKISDSEA